MSKSILVTGLVLGKESKICDCNNVNFDWIFSKSSDLLWADNVVITENEMNVVKIQSSRDQYMKAIEIVFSILQDAGMVKIISDSEISQDNAEMLADRLRNDLSLLADIIKTSDDENDPIMSIGDSHFCFPSLWTFYASLYLSFYHNAEFSLSADELSYLNILLPRKYGRYAEETGARIAIEEVLSLYLPSVQIGHPYLFENKEKRCALCMNSTKCQDGYLSDIEKQVYKVLELRQYDEIRQLCDVLNKLCERKASFGSVLTGTELWNDLQNEAKEQERKARKVLKNMSKWRKLSTFASIGLGAASFIDPAFGLTATIPTLASHLLSERENSVKKDTSWINFVNNPEQVLSNRPCL